MSACYAVDEYLVLGEAEGGSQHVAWIFRSLDHGGAVYVQNGIARAVQSAQDRLTDEQRASRRMARMTLQEVPAEEATARKGLPHEYLEAPSYRSADSDSIGSNANKVSAYGVPMAAKPVSYTAVPLAPPTGSVRREAAAEDDFGSVINALRNAASAGGVPGPAREAFVLDGVDASAERDNVSMGSRSASHSEGRPGFDEQDTMDNKTTADARHASSGDGDSMVLDLDDIAEGGANDDADAEAPPDYLYGQRLDEPGYLDTRHVRPRASELPQYADVERADSRNPYLEVTRLRPEPSGPSGEGHAGGYLDVSRGQHTSGEGHTGGYLDVSRGQHASGEGRTGGYLDVSHGRRPTGESDMGGYLDVATRSAVPEDSSGKRVNQAYLDAHRMAPGDASLDPSPAKAPPAGTRTETEDDDDDFGDLAYVLQAEGQGAEVNMEDFAAQAESMLRRLSVSGKPS